MSLELTILGREIGERENRKKRDSTGESVFEVIRVIFRKDGRRMWQKRKTGTREGEGRNENERDRDIESWRATWQPVGGPFKWLFKIQNIPPSFLKFKSNLDLIFKIFN